MTTHRYKLTWWLNMSDDTTSVSLHLHTIDQAFALIPHGPPGWERYAIYEGERLVERGDPIGPRGALAEERG